MPGGRGTLERVRGGRRREPRLAGRNREATGMTAMSPIFRRCGSQPRFSFVSRIFSLKSASLPCKMMQIHRQMMQIFRAGVPASESAYYRPRSRQIIQSSRQIPEVAAARLPVSGGAASSRAPHATLFRRGKMPHLPAPSSGTHTMNICLILPKMMQIHHRMMQIPRKVLS